MTDLTDGINQWVTLIPDYKQLLSDGTTFDNRKQQIDKRISMEIRILNHEQKANHFALMKTANNVMELNGLALETQQAVVTQNIRNIKNLEDKGKPVLTGEDFWSTQTEKFVALVGDILMKDVPLKPDKLDDKGEIIELGDEKNSKG